MYVQYFCPSEMRLPNTDGYLDAHTITTTHQRMPCRGWPLTPLSSLIQHLTRNNGDSLSARMSLGSKDAILITVFSVHKSCTESRMNSALVHRHVIG